LLLIRTTFYVALA